MSKLEELELAVWQPSQQHEPPVVTRFVLPMEAQRILVEATQARSGRSGDPTWPLLRGLSEVLTWFTPHATAATVAKQSEQWEAGPRLTIKFLGSDAVATQKVLLRAGLANWLSIEYPSLDAASRRCVVDAPLDVDNWQTAPVPLTVPRTGVCPSGEPLQYDTLVASAAGVLRGAPIQLEDRTRHLVPRGGTSNSYQGLEMVLFPLVMGRNGQWWSEVVTLTSATFPERDGLHLTARASIRHWGPIRYADAFRGPSRSLDVFMPGEENGGPAHVSFAFRARKVGKRSQAPLAGVWVHDDQKRVFELLQRLSGDARLNGHDVTEPFRDEGMWVLPRLAPGSGDRFLAAGSGVGWQDRSMIADALDGPLVAAGFQRVQPMKRISTRTGKKWFYPFEKLSPDKEQRQIARRKAILGSLRANGNQDGILEIVVLHIRERTPDALRDEIESYLGKPMSSEQGRLAWDDGLAIQLTAAPSGLFGEALPEAEASNEERERFSRAQLERIVGHRTKEAREQTASDMRQYIDAIRRHPGTLGCAMLEMEEGLQTTTRRDPYALGRHCLACERLLPQVVLHSTKPEDENKVGAALRDLLRMLGVMPLESDSGVLHLNPGALTILQVNQAYQGGKRRDSTTLPAAARVRDGILECALPSDDGNPTWMSYPEAVLKLLMGEYTPFDRRRNQVNRAKFGSFFHSVLEQMNQTGPMVVTLDASKVRHQVPAFGNGQLDYDRISLATHVLTPDSVPNLRIVRANLSAREQPFHYHRQDVKWPTGLFSWLQERAAYSLKEKPQTVKSMTIESRHAESKFRKSGPRPHPTLDEFCVVLQPESDDAMDTIRYVHKLRRAHVQFHSATRAPFPLHELMLLTKLFNPHVHADDEE